MVGTSLNFFPYCLSVLAVIPLFITVLVAFTSDATNGAS